MDSFEVYNGNVCTFPEEEHPLTIYTSGSAETRRDVLLHHDEVCGFLFLHEGVVQKAHLPKKITNFRAPPVPERSIIAAVAGTPSEYSPFSVPEATLTTDSLHFAIGKDEVRFFKTRNIAKFLKDNRKNIPNLPVTLSTDAKSRDAKVLALPLVLPVLKGAKLAEGPVDSDEVAESLATAHPMYEAWLRIATSDMLIDAELLAKSPPTPDSDRRYTVDTALPLKVLFSSKHIFQNPFQIMKREVDAFIGRSSPPVQKKSPPKTVDLVDDFASVITKTSTDETKTMERNEKVIIFTSLLFSIPEFDRNGTISSLSPGEMSDEALDILSSSTSTSEQARSLHDSFSILADEVSKEKDYLSRAAEFPFVSQTSYTYMIQCHYHTGPIDKSGDSIKKTFNFLNLLPPPKTQDDEYDRHIHSSKNAEADAMLDQPSEKRAAIRKDVFIKGRQGTLDDVLAFCGNFMIFARFWSKFDTDSHKQPLLVQLFGEVADQISSSEFKRFFDNHKNEKSYLAHTIIAYLFNISSIFIKMSKNPNVVRKFKIEQVMQQDEVRMALMMHQSLMDQLQLCAVTSSPQNLFAQPPSSYKLFFPEPK